MMATAANSQQLLSLSDVTAEQRVLLAVARLQLDSDSKATLAALIGPRLEWDSLIEEARWHKLEGLMYYHLRDPQYAPLVPEAALATMRGLYNRNVARYMYYRAELSRVLDELSSRGIPVVVLKGAELVEKVYKDRGLRPMVDLDLLVPKDRSNEAYVAVQQMGYRPVVGPDEQASMGTRDRQLAALAGIDKPIIVEIHTHVVEVDNPMRMDIELFWSETRPDTIADRPALTLKPEAEVAYLSYNFFKDRRYYSYAAIGQLCDLAEVCRAVGPANINWDMLKPGAKFGQLAGPAFCSLLLARGLVGAPVPQKVLDSLQTGEFDVGIARRLVKHRVLRHNFMARQLVQPAQRKYGFIAAMSGAFHRILPPKSYMAQKYSVPIDSKRLFLFYPRRVGESIWVGLTMIARPRRLSDELSVDRWLHDLHHSGSSTDDKNLISSNKRTDTQDHTTGGNG